LIMRLDGFLVDCHSPSESTLEVEIDCSHIGWDEYRKLIIELEDILSSIDRKFAVKSWLMRGRGLKARYSRVTANRRTRKLRFSPFPSSFRSVLTGARAHVYSLVNQHCLVLESIGQRKVYFLPKKVAPAFLEAVEALNESVIDPLRRNVEEFRNSQHYFAVEQCLHRHRVDPAALRNASFTIGRFTVDVLPVNFGYSVEADEVYAKMKRSEAVKGIEILRRQIERKQREYVENAARDIAGKIFAMAQTFDERRKLRYFTRKLDKLIELCEALGMNDMVERLLKPTRLLCKVSGSARKEMLKEIFGTTTLTEAAKKCMGIH